MVRLYILRHAKSSWATPGMRDYDRGLNERGADDLAAIAHAMRSRDLLAPHVLCSPAVRTRMTLHGVMSAYGVPPVVDYEEALYSGNVEDYWSLLRAQAGGEPRMIIGHNPMCAMLAEEAAQSGEPAMLAAMRGKFPTGCLAAIEFTATQWRQIAPAQGRLVEFVVPREL